MRPLAPAAAALLVLACGEPPRMEDAIPGGTMPPAASTTTAAATTTGDLSDPASSSTGTPDQSGPVDCVECSIDLFSMQSGALATDGAQTIGSAQLSDETVYILGTYESGRYIISADNSLVLREETDCPLLQWLGRRPDPRILVFGKGEDVDLLDVTYPARIHLPAEYIGDPVRLREDYDLVIYFEDTAHLYPDDPSDEEFETLRAYLADGGGLIASSEYVNGGSGYLTAGDVASLNRLLLPLGVEALVVNLAWGDATGRVDFPCFPTAE